MKLFSHLKISLFFILHSSFVICFSQPAERKLTRAEYIQKYNEEAVREMFSSGVPASITLAQALLESDNGNSPLALYANNHFGIKCKSWTGPAFYQDDDAKNECFRKYYSVYESYQDHSAFLKNRSRYAALFELNHLDYKAWAYGLKEAGYATNPKYPELLIKIIDENKLYQYDAATTMPPLTQADKRAEKQIESKGIYSANSKPVINLHENNCKFIIARKGDSYFKIAKDLDLRLWQIYKYNDLEKGSSPKLGDVIYLQPKRNRAKEEFHMVKEGETMHSISQLYCIKLKKLYRKNNMIIGSEPQVGQKLSLRKRLR